ncbi:MAG TPA: hypothetical protein VLV78_12765 [Thermoanaerobaculia bacterium]|nr:hypothetical protein [Thermoanaerobaculia bacterium]
MQRSKLTKGRPTVAALLLVAVCGAAAVSAADSPRANARRSTPYHVQLEAYPAAPFPFFSKFGTVTLDVYSGGVHAESFWLSGFTRNGSKTITVQNPVSRMYTDVPIADVNSIVAKLAGGDQTAGTVPPVMPPVPGKVAGVAANRYRIVYGPAAWIDVWTAPQITVNPQLRAIVDGLVNGISPGTATAARGIPGTPIYVELNFRRFKKVPLVRLKALTKDNSGEADALKVGSFYFKAPLLDAIWR